MSLSLALRVARGAAPLVALALAVPTLASAQATRTWVSGVGDDVNPCSRTAPCKTFAGAISKTAAGGEINALDDGGFGAVTITKSITIDGGHHLAGILASGTTGVIVNGTGAVGSTNIRVTLRNLSINGAGTGISGVRVLGSSSMVRIVNSEIFGFTTAGVDIGATSTGIRRTEIRRTSIHNNYGAGTNGVGIFSRPSVAGSTTRMTVSDSYIDDNGRGIVADAAIGTVRTLVRNSSIEDNGSAGGTGQGVQAFGVNANVRLSGNVISNNIIGLEALSSAQIISFSNNMITNNDTAQTPSSTLPLT